MINLLIKCNTQGIVRRLLGPSVSTVAYANYSESESNMSDLVLVPVKSPVQWLLMVHEIIYYES